ncbi:sulfotransferase family protein [Neolewinella agarilytica]|uniref:Sulfotransferase domain-containing protein n=1 Tax=Neolewinella agarilytica TaxID=478744 RepID=A0A1H9E089_9BACT|nr:sulfotransferase [Neolewinella agarilytica]SEQ18603.1 Sulfotransferase domain-containing protein [Neolewinella agarilytica]
MSSQLDFIVIGPGKCGTSWVYKILNQHPEVCVSSAKETLYFEEYFHKGDDWYSKFFKHAESGQLLGEVSNTYVFSKEVPARIKEKYPNVKLVSTIRNPVDRTFSHYLFLRRNGTLSCSFEEALVIRPDLQERGNYHTFFKQYEEHFDRSQIKVLLMEDLRVDNRQYADDLFSFLGVKGRLSDEILNEKVLPASKARSPLVARMVKASAGLVRKLGHPELITKIKYNKRVTGALYGEYKEGEKPVLSPETRKELEEYFSLEVEQLSDWLGRDLKKVWQFSK